VAALLAPLFRLLLVAGLLGAAGTRAAYDPSTAYYASLPSVAGGDTLKTALHNLIDGHTPVSSYTPGVWNALRILDEDPANSANVLLLYGGDSRAKSLQDNGTDTENYWNREHVWPVSRGMNSNTDSVGGRDLHHLFAADKSVNGRRGNLPFTDIASGGTADPEAPLSLYTSSAYEPRDADKGRVARALFYMAVRYDGSDGVSDLELVSSTSVSGAQMGNLSALLAWHRAFPPDEAERKRNHLVDTLYQGNRNPFVDNPLFADRVFNNDSPFAAWRRPHFTAAELANTAVAGDAADPDRDGLPNLLEFAFNLRPRASDAATAFASPALALLPPAVAGGAPRLGLTHRRHRYASDLVVRYESSVDLVTWAAITPAATSVVYVDALTDRVTVETPLTGARRFIRVRVDRTAP
jgi:endonuclease I